MTAVLYAAAVPLPVAAVCWYRTRGHAGRVAFRARGMR